MAEKTKKIFVGRGADSDPSFEAEDAVPVVTDELDDAAFGREPIDLDAPIDDVRVGTPSTSTVAVDDVASARDNDRDKDIAALKTQLAQANDDKLRALADLQNFRRRSEEERQRVIRDGNERLIKELLPVLDDFDLAIAAAKQAQSFEQLIGGVEATGRKFHETLAKQGVTPIESVGQTFDPDLHEAVMLDEDTDAPDETVTSELRRGYLLNSRVLRPSLVKVAKAGKPIRQEEDRHRSMADHAIRPLALGDIFDEAFDLYKDNFLFFVLVTAVATVPLHILVGVMAVHFPHDPVPYANIFNGDVPGITQMFALLGVPGGNLALFGPIYMVGYAIQMTALASATSARYLEQSADLRSVYRVPLRRIVPLLLTALLYGLALRLGFMCCYIGVLVPATLFLFTAHVFAIENQGGFRFWQPLRRSAGLVSGEGGRVFGALCLLVLTYSILSVGLELPVSYALDVLLQTVPGAEHLVGASTGVHLLSTRDQVAEQISSGVAWLMIAPFVVSVLTVLYYDLRVRKEAFDLEVLAHQLGYFVQPWSALYTPPARGRRVRPVRSTGKPEGKVL